MRVCCKDVDQRVFAWRSLRTALGTVFLNQLLNNPV